MTKIDMLKCKVILSALKTFILLVYFFTTFFFTQQILIHNLCIYYGNLCFKKYKKTQLLTTFFIEDYKKIFPKDVKFQFKLPKCQMDQIIFDKNKAEAVKLNNHNLFG